MPAASAVAHNTAPIEALVAAPAPAPAMPALPTLADVFHCVLRKNMTESTKLAVKHGKTVAQLFRQKYNQDPKVNYQRVNGKNCPVKAYDPQDVTDWIVPKLQELLQEDASA